MVTEAKSAPHTWLLHNDPADLLPFSKRLIPDDTDAQQLPKAYIPSSPELQ